MSYYQAPEEILDDPAEAAKLAKQAYETALRSAADKDRKKSSCLK
ncbi:MAG: TfoX/Sxy family protein [Proteobacteria bacterium]|nr:TfoX/Sxy family protein [Pseudomonadota bacterium]